MTASTSSTLRPTTSGTLVAGFPRGRFSASPGTRVLSFSRASSTTSPADALRGFGPRGAREGAGDVAAGRIERSARPLPVAGAGLDQAAQRLVCGAAPRAVLDGHLIARQADRAVDVADRTGPASSRTPYPTAEQAGPQVLRAPVAAALSSPPPDPLPGLAAALRGLTHEAARFPQLHSASSSSMIRYQTDDEGVVSQPEYTLTKPSNGPNDRDHLTPHPRASGKETRPTTVFASSSSIDAACRRGGRRLRSAGRRRPPERRHLRVERLRRRAVAAVAPAVPFPPRLGLSRRSALRSPDEHRFLGPVRDHLRPVREKLEAGRLGDERRAGERPDAEQHRRVASERETICGMSVGGNAGRPPERSESDLHLSHPALNGQPQYAAPRPTS